MSVVYMSEDSKTSMISLKYSFPLNILKNVLINKLQKKVTELRVMKIGSNSH